MYTALSILSYDIIALVETNLTSEIGDCELGLNDYTVFRCDRSTLTSSKASGGGALIAVHNTISCTGLFPSIKNTESVFVKCSSLNLIIGCTYLPPNQPTAVYTDFFNSVDEVLGGEPIGLLLLGDFNRPDTDWIKCHGLDESSRLIIDMAAYYGLKQVNHTKNSRGVILDLVLSSLEGTVCKPSVDLLVPEDIHHPALDILISKSHANTSHTTKYILNHRDCNVTEVFRHIQSWNIPGPCDRVNADELFDLFSSKLTSLIKQYTPIKRVVNSNFPRWFSAQLKYHVIQKKIAHKRFRIGGSPFDLERFRNLRRKCKELAAKCHSDYIERVEASIPHNVKSFWTHVDNLRGNPALPAKMFLDEEEASDSLGKCNLFARNFSSVFNKLDIHIPSFDFGSNGSLSRVVIDATEIERKLKAIDSNKSPGPDNISPRVLKFCAPVISSHLAVLFNALLAVGIFPTILKQSYVVPIYKSGDKSNVKNYRPIAIQSAIAKIFESLVLDRLNFFLAPYISQSQHGFSHGRSTITNLLVFNEYIMSAFLDTSQVDCIYLDFSKAFDKVHHDLLIAKLEGYGVCGQLLMWLKSYLEGRRLLVKLEGSLSEPFPVLSGVPQGSLLGPLLFSAFINDISTHMPYSRSLMFADDIKIFSRVHCSVDQEDLQRSLSSVEAWSRANAMELNIDKCQVMSFSRSRATFIYDYSLDGIILKRVTSVKDLGILLNPTLSPLDHIVDVTSRAFSLLGFIIRTTRHFRSFEALLLLYRSLVLPILEYGSVIWSPYQLGHIKMLGAVQSRFLRVLGVRLGYRYLEVPVPELQRHFQLSPLHLRRKLLDLVFLYKLVNRVIDCPELLANVNIQVPRGTRSGTIFGRSYQPTNYAYNHGLSRIQRFGGAAAGSVDFFMGTLQSFKKDVYAKGVL